MSGKAAGLAAIMAGLCWLLWIAVTHITAGGAGSSRSGKLIQLAMAGWNLLLVPAALDLAARNQARTLALSSVPTVCGLLSLAFWAYGGLTNTITPASEIAYLLLSGVWWTGIGITIRSENKILGVFTAALGGFALLDATLSLLEPIPFYIYALAAPKLPLSIAWDFWIGIFLFRNPTETVCSTRP